jgi:thiol-disulfide isomerase/thioredoxin
MELLNHYSFLILAGFSLAALLIYTMRRGLQKHDLIAFGALLIGLSIAFWVFQPAQTESPDLTYQNLESLSQPALIQFQSPYCLACMASRPMVLSLIEEAGDELVFVPVDITDPGSASLTERYNVQFTPTFILINANGVELLRNAGALDRDQVMDHLQKDSTNRSP